MNGVYIHTTSAGHYRSQYTRTRGLLDLSFRRASFGSYKKLLGWKNERRAFAFCKKLVDEMILEVVCRMVENGDQFVLPIKGKGVMFVADFADPSSRSSRVVFPSIVPRERHNSMTLKLRHELSRRHARNGIPRYYRVRLEHRHKMAIQQRLDQGHTYLPA